MPLLDPLNPQFKYKPGDKQQWGGLKGSAMSLALANIAQKHNSLTLVITADTATAQRMEQELSFFLRSPSEQSAAPHFEPNFQPSAEQNAVVSKLPIFIFPDWETLPYDTFSAHQDIISQRLFTLYHLPKVEQGLLIVPITTLMHRLAPKEYVHGNSLLLSVNQHLNIDKMRHSLESSGYRCVESVYEHGEFAVRGSIIDIFPMGSASPYRVEMFDDEIETLRTFDPESQRTLQKVQEIRLLPAKEYPLDSKGVALFRQNWHEHFNVDHRRCPIYQDISNGVSPAGIEYFLALFFGEASTLFDYLPQDTLVVTTGPIENAADQLWKEINDRYEDRRVNPEHPLLPPHKVFLPKDEIYRHLKSFSRIDTTAELLEDRSGQSNFHCQDSPNLPIEARNENPLAAVENFLIGNESRVLFCAESAGRRETLLELLQRVRITPQSFDTWQAFLEADSAVGITIAPLEAGLALLEPKITLIAEPQLFGHQIMQRRRRKKVQDTGEMMVKNLTELRIGAPVVHLDHGVGRYRGLQNITYDGQEAEFLTLEYANDAKLYVPVSSLHLISRYSGAEEDFAPLHKLGSDQWQKAKKKAAEKIRDVAAELLDIYARREAKVGFIFTNPKETYQAFAAGFPFEETPDQESTINAVRSDMLSQKSMDRLVCGDVGFGKTEVAMRAAFIAVHSGKQVAILVPTTLLAQQHFETFKDRFADWPVNIDVISRFRSAKEQTEIEKRIVDGKIDIIIGTHKLLQSGVKYKDLGLLIIDEEHRFGVKQKESLKSMRSEVDILTLTATPIPRTLNMAMSGMRDLSIIATPPEKRLSVKTFIRTHSDSLVKEAIQREILRGGQVYYLHNEVSSIERCADELRLLIPEGRVTVGHGQMRERDLERVMSDFYHKRFNILVCTTIIETGIDVPSANTIIIDRADKFGLAQLHQLRGRVGRSHHQAYAYMLTPNKKSMTADAIKRLEAIEAASELGSGFMLASHDLEIRGAGELLGEDQSGQIESIGFSLYMEMLERAVESIKEGKTLDLDKALHQGAEINLRIPALIPDDYLPDVHSRLILYKRIANAHDDDDLRELQVEMIDRFGLLPEPVKNLFRVTSLKLIAQKLKIEKIEAGAESGRIEFSSETAVDPLTLVKMVQTQPQRYKLEGATYLRFVEKMDTADHRIQTVHQLLERLTKAA